MELQKLLIYFILAIIWYGFNFLKKRNQKRAEKPAARPAVKTFRPDPNLPQKPASRPDTISDILEELKRKEKESFPASYTEGRSLEGKGYEEGSERIVIEDVNPYTSFRTISEERKEDTGARFAAFEPAVAKKHPIRQALADRNRMKDAFIISEILKKKDF